MLRQDLRLPAKKNSTTVEELLAPTDVALYDYHQTGEGYKVVFTDNDADMTVAEGDIKSFEVYLNDTLVGTVSNSGDIIDTLKGKGLTSGTQYAVTVKEVLNRTNADGTEESLKSTLSVDKNYITYNMNEVLDNGIAKVFVNTSRDEKVKDFNLYKAQDKAKINSSIMVVDKNGISQVTGTDTGTIALRGNSTAGGQKRPYNIKFTQKQNLFNFGKAKKWSLLANTFDKTMIRNQVGMQFHNVVESLYQPTYAYTSKSEVVDLYVDGRYLGTYTLLESVEAGSTRVDISPEADDTGFVNNEILIELDSTGRDEAAEAHLPAKTSTYQYGFTINEVEGPGTAPALGTSSTPAQSQEEWEAEKAEYDATYGEKNQYVLDYLNAFEAEISKEANSDFDKISEMIDVNSFVNYYITAELFKITDIDFSSTRFYIKGTSPSAKGGEKLYAGPLWDLDLSSGNNANSTVEGLHAQDNKWFGALMKNPEFKKMVRDRYEELLPLIKALYADAGTVQPLEINQITVNPIVVDDVVAAQQKSINANYSVAYNEYSVGNAATGYGDGWKVNLMYNNTGEAGTSIAGVSGSTILYDNYANYITDYKEWLSGRNAYLMKQFGADDKDAELTEISAQIGNRFYNLAKGTTPILGGKITEGAGESGIMKLTNGEIPSNVGAGHVAIKNNDENKESPVFVTIDLGKYYKASALEAVVTEFKHSDDEISPTSTGAGYKIRYSADNRKFKDVVVRDNVTAYDDTTNYRFVDDVSVPENTRVITTVSPDEPVRYIQVYYPKTADYGMQLTEVAVIDSNKDAATKILAEETVTKPLIKVNTSDTANALDVTITDGDVQGGYTYDVYVDGEIAKSDVSAGTVTLEDLKVGEHQVYVVAYRNGFASEQTDTINGVVVGNILVADQIGDSLYNLALNKDVTVSKRYVNEGNQYITDTSLQTEQKMTNGIYNIFEQYCGISGSEVEGNWGAGNEVSATIDLGDYYDASTIDKIFLQYSTNGADKSPMSSSYKVQYSMDGIEYYDAVAETKVTEFQNDENIANATIDNVSSVKGFVRYVRAVYPKVGTYGIHITEMAVLAMNPQTVVQKEVPAPTVTATVPEGTYNTVEVTITANTEAVEGTTYRIYLDGELIKTVDTAGTYTLTDVPAGTHTISVQASLDGWCSEVVTAMGELTIEAFNGDTFVAKPLYNLAYKADGSNASCDESSVTAPGDIKFITDGIIGETGTNDRKELNVKTEGTYFQADLEKVYTTQSIDQVIVWYRQDWDAMTPYGSECTGYDIQFSKDGTEFVTVKSVTQANLPTKPTDWDGKMQDIIDKTSASALIPATRYVRVVYHGKIEYGAQARELAVFNTTGTAEEYVPFAYDALTDEEINNANIPTDANWSPIGGSSIFAYYCPGAQVVQTTSLNGNSMVLGFNIGADLVGTIGDETIEKFDTGANLKFDVDGFTTDGIYLLNLSQGGNDYKVYIRKSSLKDYAVSGIATSPDVAAQTADISWTTSEDAITAGYTYNVTIGEKVIATGLTATTGILSAVNISDLTIGGTYTVTVETVDGEGNVVGSAEGSFNYTAVEPDYYDFRLDKVDVSYAELVAGQTITMTATITNIGKSVTENGNKLVMHVVNDNGAEDSSLTGGSYSIVNDNVKFAYGETITWTWTGTIQQKLIDQGYIRFRVTPEADFANKDTNMENNYYTYTITPDVLPPNNVSAALNTDKTATVTWEAPDAENTYTYNVYVDGNLVTETPISDLTYTTAVLEEGAHTITVKAVLNEKESKGASANVLVYDLSDANWVQWKNASRTDKNGNVWYIAENKLDYANVDTRQDYVLIINNGNQFQFIIRNQAQTDSMVDIETVTINGTAYSLTGDATASVIANGDIIKADVSLFPVPEDKPYEVYVISVTGLLDGAVTTKSFVVKVVNPLYTSLTLENKDGSVSLGWDADATAVGGYEITYTVDETTTVDGVTTTTAVTKTTTVPAGTTSYNFTENEIVLKNNTKVIVKPIIDEAGTVGEEIDSATALADLVFEDFKPASVIFAGQTFGIVATVKNIGTAKADADKNPADPQIAVTAVFKQGTTSTSKNTLVKAGLEPNKTADFTINDYVANDLGEYSIEGQIDDANRISESDKSDESNKKTITGTVVDKDAAKLSLDETGATPSVKLTWNAVEGITEYKVTYTSADGTTITDSIPIENLVYDEATSKYSYNLPVSLKNNTGVYVYSVSEGTDTIIGADNAQVDLVISAIGEPVGEVRIGYTFDISITIKNQGTAQIEGSTSDVTEEFYPYTIPAVLKWTQADGKIEEKFNDAYHSGLAAGETTDLEFKEIAPTTEGDTVFTFEVDALTWADGGFVNESDETNNEKTATIKVAERIQIKEMDWTRLVSADAAIAPTGDIYPFPVANGSQTAYIDYKVVDSTNTKIDYKDLVSRYVGYAGANMTIEFNNAAGEFVNSYIDENDVKHSTTKVELAQIPNYDETDDAASMEKAVWLTMPEKANILHIKDENGNEITKEPDTDSPIGYVGNGMNMYVGNFGLYKYYATRFTAADGESITVVYRVTDDKEHTGTWTQAYVSGNGTSNPEALPIPYCGASPIESNDAWHDGHGGAYETTGALWYDNGDIQMSSISIYNGNWLAIATSEYVEFAKDTKLEDGTLYKNWWVEVARATTDPNQNNKFIGVDTNVEYTDEEKKGSEDGWFKVDPNKTGNHVGIQGTNTVQVGLPWLFEDIPVHSGMSGQKDIEFYWIRIYPDRSKPEWHIEIPVTLYADIPQIQPAQNVLAWTSINDMDDSTDIMLSWSVLPIQNTCKYTYRVFIGDTQINANGVPCSEGEDAVYTTAQTLEFNATSEINSLLTQNNNQITVKAYWCEQEIETSVSVQGELDSGWYLLDGESNIEILAGDKYPTNMEGTISYYYNRQRNHASAVVGYNEYYISFNGNINYFNEDSTVSVMSGFTSREEVESYEAKAFEGTLTEDEQHSWKQLEKIYNPTEGQLQITASELMKADHNTSCYLVRVETPSTDVDGNSVTNTTYMMLESVVKAQGDVEVRGFQMNTNYSPGAVSEFAPSFRVVSRASKIVEVADPNQDSTKPTNNLIKAVVKQGTIYALASDATEDNMIIDCKQEGDEFNITTGEKIYQLEATDDENKGVIHNWAPDAPNGEDAVDTRNQYTYYAVTFRATKYTLSGLSTEYALKAYAVTEDGEIIYEQPKEGSSAVKKASVQSVSKALYENKLMASEALHNYLYDNVLNIVAISENRGNIVNAMLKALKVTSTTQANYTYVNNLNRDLYYYTYLSGLYKYDRYIDRGTFTSKTMVGDVENEKLLLEALNTLQEEQYVSVADWIYSNVTNGFYRKVDYVNTEIVDTGEVQ